MKHYTKFFVVIVIFSLVLSGCNPAEQDAGPTPENGGIQDFGAVISATGVVVPEQWAVLSPRSQGVIAEVLVSEGEQVAAGQLLIRLDGQDAAEAKLRAAQLELTSAQQALDTLNENAGAETARARQALAAASQSVVDAGRLMDPFDEQQYEDDLESARQLVAETKEDLKTAQDDFEPYASLDETNATRKTYKERLDDAQQKYDEALRSLQELEVEKEQAAAALQLAEAGLVRAQTEYDRRKDGPDSNLLALAQSRLALAEAQVKAAGEAVANLELRAPFDGAVCNLDARAGEWVTPGIPVLQLGNLNNLRVETTDLSEIDAARVHPQDVVLVTFDALPDVVVNGSVQSVAKKSAEGSGVNYTTVIVLDTLPAGLRWGMTAFADIEVSQ